MECPFCGGEEVVRTLNGQEYSYCPQCKVVVLRSIWSRRAGKTMTKAVTRKLQAGEKMALLLGGIIKTKKAQVTRIREVLDEWHKTG